MAKTCGSIFVPEYLRLYLQQKPAGYVCQYSDITAVAYGQLALENELQKRAKRWLFCDTGLILLSVYSQFYFTKVPQVLQDLIAKQNTDEPIFLTDEQGIAWVADGQRDLPFGRAMIRQKIVAQLNALGRDFVPISGDLDKRVRQCLMHLAKISP